LNCAWINADLTANNKKYQADYQNGKYGFTVDNEFHPFNQGTIYLGQYSANTTIDVSDLGATSDSQFLVACDANASASHGFPAFSISSTHTANYFKPSVALSGDNNTLTLTVGILRITVATGGQSNTSIPTSVYYVGDITTRS
jgi:hypothetical protein